MSGSTSTGSGPDTLVVTLCEDAYQGDAQANIAVDGKQLNATPLTVTAQRSKGQTQAFTFKGTWGPGQHTIAVMFLNDDWGGSPTTDRNLWVDAITLNGAAVSGLTAPPMIVAGGANGTNTYTVTVPVPAPAPTTATLTGVTFDPTSGKLTVPLDQLKSLIDSLDEPVNSLPVIPLSQAAWVPASTDGTSLDGRVAASEFTKAGS